MGCCGHLDGKSWGGGDGATGLHGVGAVEADLVTGTLARMGGG